MTRGVETDERRRGGGARPLVLARGFSACVTLLIPLVLARVLTVSEYGTFKQFFLISSTLYLVLGLGIPQSLYYFLPRAMGSDRRAFLGQTLLFLLVAGGVGAALVRGGGGLLAQVGGEALVEVAGPMALYVWLLLGGAALEAGLTAQGRTRAAALSYVVSDSARAAAFLIPALAGLGLEGALWGAAAFASLRTVAAWVVLLRGSRGPLVQGRLLRRQVVYALPYGGAMLVAMPQQQLHQYAVALTSDPAAFALYAVGCFNLPVVDLLYTPTTEILMYRLGEMERRRRPAQEAVRAFRDAVGKLALAFVPLALGVFAVAPSFLSLLYGPAYEGAAPILRVSLASVVLATLPVDGVLRAKARTRALFFSYLAKIALSVPLVFGALHALGPIGAMIGFVCTEAIHKLGLLILASRALVGRGTLASMAEAFPLGEFTRAAVAGVGALGLVLVVRAALPLAPLPAVLLQGGAFGVFYVGALVLGGVRISQLRDLILPGRT